MSEYGILDMDNNDRRPIVVTPTYNPQYILGELLFALWEE